jgi:hypothetical protein
MGGPVTGSETKFVSNTQLGAARLVVAKIEFVAKPTVR